MKKRYIIASIAGLGLITALVAGKPMMDGEKCHGFGKHQMMGGGNHNQKEFFKKILKELDLSDTQKSQIKAIASKQKEKMREKKRDRQGMRGQGGMPDMSLFMSADKFDRVTFKKVMIAKQEKRAEKMREMRERRLDQRADRLEQIFGILTPKQRVEFIELSKKKNGS